MPGFLVLAGRLAAQPDPVILCQEKAGILVNTPPDAVSAWVRGGLDNGNYILWWDARLASGRIVSGFCEANSRTNRIVRLGTNQTDSVNRTYRLTPRDAEGVCQREARARFSPGNGEIYATFMPHSSTGSLYRVEWRYDSITSNIRKGRCEIDSYTGRIRRFDAGIGW